MMDLSLNDRVIDLIKREIRKTNDRLPEKRRIHRVVLLPKELHPDDDELTRTRKLKRNVIDERYHSVVEALYSGDSTHDLDVMIRYMDGGTSRLKSKLRLEEV
jgi:long-chain acyl-CoA synthetase